VTFNSAPTETLVPGTDYATKRRSLANVKRVGAEASEIVPCVRVSEISNFGKLSPPPSKR
jgi:hypothetical protein